MTDATPRDLEPLAALLRQVRDLKRVRDNRSPRSLAERQFARSWARLVDGEPLAAVALSETAAAVAAVRLAGLDAETMRAHGLSEGQAQDVVGAAFDDVAGPVGAGLHGRLRPTLGTVATGLPPGEAEPPFVDALVRQPRAGATHPGLPRRVLEPAESHGDHSFAVAAFGVLLAPRFGAEPAPVFLTGLAHHLFNTTLPDAGYAADELMGDGPLAAMAQAAADRALDPLPGPLRGDVRRALAVTGRDQFETAEAQAFHAADVLDRVLEMEWHQQAARFQLEDALGRDTDAGQLDICHPGFYQAFQQDVLARAGVWDGAGGTADRSRQPSGSYERGGHGAVPAASPLAGGPGAEDGRRLGDGAEIAHLERREMGS